MGRQKNNYSLDAIILTGIKFLSIGINILSSAVLSKMISLEEFGTYSTGNLIVTLTANITILGMMDAVNYFYHQKQCDKKESINTIYFLQIILGIGSAFVIYMLRGFIISYFNNPLLNGIYIYIIFRPMLENLSNSLLSLQMAIGKARQVGIQNAVFAVSKLIFIVITVTITKNISTIFIAYLVMDTVTVYYYYFNFKKVEFAINPFLFRKNLIIPILKFAVPMGLYIMTNSVTRDLDKIVIGRFESTSQLAVYSNCATLLPIGIVSAAFLTVIVPVITRMIQNDEWVFARNLFRNYLSVGFISTSILAVVCIVLSEEVILLLYGSRYLAGKSIFVLYVVVDLIRFANISLVLAAKGKTRTLMRISFCMLIVNMILNFVFYYMFGMIGPAIATVIVTFMISIVLLNRSGIILQIYFIKLIDWKLILKTSGVLLVAAFLGSVLREKLVSYGVTYFSRLCVIGGLFCVGTLFANLRTLKSLFYEINYVCKKSNTEVRR